MPSDAAKKAKTCFTKCCSGPESLSQSLVSWDKSISWISVLGFVIFFAGLFAYSYLTFKSRNRATPTKPTEASKEGEAPKAPKETTKLVSS